MVLDAYLLKRLTVQIEPSYRKTSEWQIWSMPETAGVMDTIKNRVREILTACIKHRSVRKL